MRACAVRGGGGGRWGGGWGGGRAEAEGAQAGPGAGQRGTERRLPPPPAVARARPRPAERLPLAAPAGSWAVGGAGGLPGRSPAPAAGARKSRPGLRRGLLLREEAGRPAAAAAAPAAGLLSPLGWVDAAGAVRMEQTEGEGSGRPRRRRPARA